MMVRVSCSASIWCDCVDEDVVLSAFKSKSTRETKDSASFWMQVSIEISGSEKALHLQQQRS